MRFFKCFSRAAKPIQSDPLQPDRVEFNQYKLAVEQCKKTFEDFETALNHLNPMHDDFNRRLTIFFEQGPGEIHDRVICETNSLARIKESFKEAKEEYFSLKSRSERVYEEILTIERKLNDRDKAYSDKMYYDRKVEHLNQKESLIGTAKMDRNLKKKATASNRWGELDALTSKDLRRIMDERFVTIEELVTLHIVHLRKYYALIDSKLTEVVNAHSVLVAHESGGGGSKSAVGSIKLNETHSSQTISA